MTQYQRVGSSLFAAPREQVALASCLEASHSLRTVGKGDGVGAVVDVEVRRRTHQPVL